jgi:hypothetical protein
VAFTIREEMQKTTSGAAKPDGDVSVVFQFSLQKAWEAKLRKDARKIARTSEGTSRFVFVTSQDVTGAKRDQLRREFKSTYNWELSIYSREWFRHKLTQFDQDSGNIFPPTASGGVAKPGLFEIG